MHHNTIPRLSSRHTQILQQESGISPDVIAERGVRTITEGRELPSVYSWRQKRRAPGILFTVHRPNGEKATIFRPDEPDPQNPGHKYEQECKHYGGAGNVLDVHPRVAHWIEDVGVPVVFTEGTKKADSIISAAHREDTDILTVAISGVWNFLSEGEPIPDMHEIPVNGRKVYIGFDSDVFRNPDVSDAARRLAGHLEGQGAEVCLFYLTGADLSGASLNSADLAGTHLHGANLSGAMGLTDWQITAAQSLEGATMPNGQQYEEWLKDKKAKGKDEKNE